MLVTCLLVVAPAFAQNEAPSNWSGGPRKWFEAEVEAGIDSLGSPVATIRLVIPHRHLVFFKEEDEFVARYRVRASQRNEGRGVRATEWGGEVRVESYAQTRGEATEQRAFRWSLAELGDARPSEVAVQVEVEGTQRIGRVVLPVVAAAVPPQGVALGPLSLYRQRDPTAQAADSILAWSGHAGPDPDRFQRRESSGFDLSTGPPWVLVRIFDLRGDAVPAGEVLHLQVRAEDEETVSWDQGFDYAPGQTELAFLIRIPPDALSFGANTVEARLDGGSSALATVENFGLSLFDQSSWEANLLVVRVLADDDERRALEDAEATDRQRLWDDFWARRDPQPQLPGNPRLEEHYRRVEFARAQLRDGMSDGALSDRGRVYIRYGKPDSIESQGSNGAAFEVWRYLDDGDVFYFRDTFGLGHFRLVYREQL